MKRAVVGGYVPVLFLEELEPRIAPSAVGLGGDAGTSPAESLTAVAGVASAQADSAETVIGGLIGTPPQTDGEPLTSAPTAGAVILPVLPPDYDWWYGCTPTAAGMMFAWWDLTYDSDVFPGDPTDWVYGAYPSSNPDDFTHANGVVAGWNHAQNNPSSYQGHPPDSLADFLLTEDGATYSTFMTHGLEAFAAWDDPDTPENESFVFSATLHSTQSGWTYADYRAEIDAGRPVLLNLYSPSGGHTVLGVGYNDTGGPHIEVLTTWNWGVQEWEWANEDDTGFGFSVQEGLTLMPVPQPVPELSAYIDLAHTYVGDLTVRVGLGDPSSPLWTETVWDGQGGGDHNLVLTNIDLTEALAYLHQTQNWFLEVTDGAAQDTGSIEDFQIWFGGRDGERWFTSDTGTPIDDFSTAYAYLTTDVPLPLLQLDPASDTGISNSDLLTNDTTPLVNVTVPEPGTIWLDFDNDGLWDTSIAAPTAGTYQAESPVTLADGVRTIQAMLEDTQGGQRWAHLDITVDTVGPAAPYLPDLDPASDTGRYQVDNLTADTTPVLHLSGFGDYYRLFRDGLQVSPDFATDPTFTETTPLADGTHAYVLRAVDPAGNLSPPSAALNVTVDTTPPTVLNTTPAEGSHLQGIVSQVSADFSEWMDDLTTTDTTIMLEGSGGDGTFGDGNEYFVPMTVTYEFGPRTAVCSLDGPLGSDLYHLHLTGGIRDLAGNPLDGDGDGIGGDPYVGEFRIDAACVWQQGSVTVTVYDKAGGIDFAPEDIQVRFGRDDSVTGIRLGGSLSMDGVGLVIHGATSVGRITDARRGPIGDLAFIACDAPLRGISLRGPLAGYNLNGESLGGIDFPADLDGDGLTDDLTSLYVTGDLGTTRITGQVGGDLLVDGAVSNLQTSAPILGDVTITGEARNLRIGGDLGHAGGLVHIGGNLNRLTVSSRGGAADLLSDLRVDGTAGGLSIGSRRDGGGVFGDIEVGGSLKTLMVAGDVSANVVVHGDVSRAAVWGDLGDVGTTFQVDGLLRNLSVGSRRAAGDLLGDLVVGADVTRVAIYGEVRGEVTVGGGLRGFTGGLICDRITVAGDLGSLATASEVLPGVAPVDFVFDNPDPLPDGELTVGGAIGRIRSI